MSKEYLCKCNKLNRWVCTDPDMCQFRKKVSDNTYLFTELDTHTINPNGDMVVDYKKYNHLYVTEDDILGDDFRTMIVSLKDYSEEDVRSCADAFGYDYEDIKDNKELIAECIFELGI